MATPWLSAVQAAAKLRKALRVFRERQGASILPTRKPRSGARSPAAPKVRYTTRTRSFSAEPGTAAEHPVSASTICPRRTIRGRPAVALVVAILDPFPDIAVHVVEAERIGRERADRGGLPASHWLPQPLQLALPLPISSPQEYAVVRAGARRVFPFGLGQQPVGLAGHAGQPGHILLGVVPAHVDHRPRAASLAGVAGPAHAQPPSVTQASHSSNVTSNSRPRTAGRS